MIREKMRRGEDEVLSPLRVVPLTHVQRVLDAHGIGSREGGGERFHYQPHLTKNRTG